MSTITPHSLFGRFSVKNGEVESVINFRPLIEKHQLAGHFVLVHWNKIARIWGVYDGFSNDYHLVDGHQVLTNSLLHMMIDVDQASELKPTNVVLYPNARAEVLADSSVLLDRVI